jgi:hypothetical protein
MDLLVSTSGDKLYHLEFGVNTSNLNWNSVVHNTALYDFSISNRIIVLARQTQTGVQLEFSKCGNSCLGELYDDPFKRQQIIRDFHSNMNFWAVSYDGYRDVVAAVAQVYGYVYKESYANADKPWVHIADNRTGDSFEWYIADISISNNKLYILRDIQYPGVPRRFQLYYVPNYKNKDTYWINMGVPPMEEGGMPSISNDGYNDVILFNDGRGNLYYADVNIYDTPSWIKIGANMYGARISYKQIICIENNALLYTPDYKAPVSSWKRFVVPSSVNSLRELSFDGKRTAQAAVQAVQAAAEAVVKAAADAKAAAEAKTLAEAKAAADAKAAAEKAAKIAKVASDKAARETQAAERKATAAKKIQEAKDAAAKRKADAAKKAEAAKKLRQENAAKKAALKAARTKK